MGKPTTLQTRPRILPQQKLPTRDGVELCTDVFLPESTEVAPTVVVRTPYGRSQPFLLRLAVRLNQAGYAVALQDCRGRYQSTGTLDWLAEENDTRDTLSWLAAKDFSDGRFGLIGMSISSHPCFAVAADPPAGTEVATVINAMGVVDFRSLFYQQDAMVLHWALPWTHAMDEQRMPAQMESHRPWKELYRPPSSARTRRSSKPGGRCCLRPCRRRDFGDPTGRRP
ncbi:MAG: CocE/NonD family hydrolase, partial [Acidobacteriota bacterium]